MASESMDNLSNQIRDLYSKASAEERQHIQEQLRDLQNDIFTDWEVLFNIAMGPLRWSLAQIAVDLNIFSMLHSTSSPMSHQELVEKTGAAPNLLGCLVQAMASFGLIRETSKDHFTANRVSKTFVNPHVEGSMVHISELHVPVARVFPQYLKDHNYQEINSITDLPFHKALNTHLEPFEYLKTNPVQMKALGHVMVVDAVKHWVSSFPVVETVGSFAVVPESALLVDIGGSFGEHSIAFKNKFPKLPGRVVVQDLPSTLAHLPTPRPEDIEFHEYDFFTPQPIRGAKFYYLRHVLHDWPDDECVRILKNIIPAMGSDSVILIDEVVLPETRVPWQVSAMVLSMMACLGGTERSRPHWARLLDRSGLKIADVHRYDDTRFQSIVVATPK